MATATLFPPLGNLYARLDDMEAAAVVGAFWSALRIVPHDAPLPP